MDDLYRLRYEVYCEERNFLAADSYPAGLEFDGYDGYATHFAVYGNDDTPVGYLRTVPARGGNDFPMADHGLALASNVLPGDAPAVEVSRMIVSAGLRRERRHPVSVFPATAALPIPLARTVSDLVQLKLLRLAYREAVECGTGCFIAAMEPPLARKMNMLGLPFRQAGPPGDYYGQVAPYAMDLREMAIVMHSRFLPTWEFFSSEREDPDCVTIRRAAPGVSPTMAAA